jgi:di/tricarboxylate transporter
MADVVIEDGPKSLTAFIIVACLFACTVTNFMSNVAAANIIIPPLACVGPRHGYSPVMVLFPVLMSTCLALLFPMGSPCNAIVLANGSVTLMQMVKVGIVATIIFLTTILLYSLYVFPLFSYTKLVPDTAHKVCE